MSGLCLFDQCVFVYVRFVFTVFECAFVKWDWLLFCLNDIAKRFAVGEPMVTLRKG